MSQEDVVVVALGGNAIIQKGEKGDIHQQFTNTRQSMKEVYKLVEKGLKVILTHGNSPQVGNLMLMAESARDIVPDTPLGIADAMTAGSMGPKMAAAIEFIQANPENRVITTNVENLNDAVDGKAGTIITAY